MRKLTTEEFIENARAVHGDRYDYSKVEYLGREKPVTIICPEHGEFDQKPSVHVGLKSGCPKCGNIQKVQTCLKKYGVPVSSQAASVKEKMKVTNKRRYGGASPQCSEDVREKSVQTLQEKYGISNTMESDEFREKIRQSNLEHFGSEWAAQNPEIRQKQNETCQERYGSNSPLHDKAVKAKAEQTMLEVYGVKHPVQSDEIRARMQNTVLQRYGADHPMRSDSIKNKVMATVLEHYGVSHPMQSNAVKVKVVQSKAEHGTFHTSQPEENLYIMLCGEFGSDDVERQHTDFRYPFACDFYIKSRDLFIELNGNWTHNDHWFDLQSEQDLATVKLWQEKGTKYYSNAVSVWTGLDVRKRETARRNNLNYIVFWGCSLDDVRKWIGMGCPDGHDWEHEYFWFPVRNLRNGIPAKDIDGKSSFRDLSLTARYYQHSVFYQHEIALWEQNPMKDGCSLQQRLYHNRYKYLGKTPLELSNKEILRGFTISGLHKGYTVFDSSLMDQAVQKHGIKSVYDPCAGWGERLLYCYQHGMPYQGCDINEDLIPGYEQMKCDYGMTDQDVEFTDSAMYNVKDLGYDAVLTCPPYGNIEKYTDKGAEQLSHDEFLSWWSEVVARCTEMEPRLFCFQINTKWHDAMAEIVEAAGYRLIDEFYFKSNKSSHMTRGKNGVDHKKERESMLVFERV